MTSLDQQTEMYLKPVAGSYDWVTIPAPLVESDVLINRGFGRRNSEPSPGRIAFEVQDAAGNFNPKNPMGAYFGSLKLGTQLRHSIISVNDQFGRTETNTWGSVGNLSQDAWTNGTSSGGTVNATDWTVSSGSAKHSVPATNAFRVSNLSQATKPFTDSEIHLRRNVSATSMSGTGGMATEVWFRALDSSNFVGVTLRFEFNETIQLKLFDRTAGSDRILVNFTTISGLTLASGHVDYELRCQVEGTTVRAKVWEVGAVEPQDWQVYATQATVREGYTAVASYVYTGNTNTLPNVASYDFVRARLVEFTGEVTKLNPTKESNFKTVEIEAADVLDRIQSGSAPQRSAFYRGKTSVQQWMTIGTLTAGSGTVRTFTLPTASLGLSAVGDFFFLFDTKGVPKEETKFVITGSSVAGANTTYTFEPDAREAVLVGEQGDVFRPSASTNLPIVYWPCEDGKNATQVSSGLVGGSPMSIVGSPNFTAETGIPSSAPFLKFNDAELTGIVPVYTDTYAAFTMGFELTMPATDETPATGTDVLQWYTTGTGFSFDLRYTATTGGCLRLLVFNAALTQIYDSGDLAANMRGDKAMIVVYLQQVGGSTQVSIYKVPVSGSVLAFGPNTMASVTTLGRIVQVRANPGGGYDDVGFGHLWVTPGLTGSSREFQGWNNEGAFRRIGRLCHEEKIPFTSYLDWDIRTGKVGAQGLDKLIDQFKQPVATDDGFLYGPKGQVAVELRSRGSLTNQAARATFNCSTGQLQEFAPIYDNAETKNYVTVNRIDGTSAIAEETTGPFSTTPPPVGLGRKDDSFTLSLSSDYWTQKQADWRLGIGTIDQYRVEDFTVESAMARDLSIERLTSIGLGDRVDITNATSRNIYDTLSLLVLGYTLKLGNRFAPELKLICMPYDIYSGLALTADRYARLDGFQTLTAGTLTTSATGSLSVSMPATRLWTTDAADFPFDVMITGERITLSGIADVSVTSQTFTISARSVNGVVKTHAVGEEITLAEPNYWQF